MTGSYEKEKLRLTGQDDANLPSLGLREVGAFSAPRMADTEFPRISR